MFRVEKQVLAESKIHKYIIFQNDNQLSFANFLSCLIGNKEFREFYNQILVNSEFDAFFWENPPCSIENLNQDYEFVLVKSKIFSKLKADSKTFSKHFIEDKSAVDFPNLGKNAQLIVPTPKSELESYTHLGDFVRNALNEQIHDFWQLVGKVYKSEINQGKRWLSTHGLGVHWLHVRVDTVPKYYHFKAYKFA